MLLFWSLSVFLSLTTSPSTVLAASPKESAAPDPCTIRSPTSGAFFDLNPLHIQDPSTLGSSKPKHPRDNSWNATGYDMGYNFTMNFCGGVIEDLEAEGGVVGVKDDMWRNISAYYKQGGKVYSMGMENHAPVIRGRKLVLNYTDGSPCDTDAKRRHAVQDLVAKREIIDPHEDDDDEKDDEDEDDEDDGGRSSSRKSGKGSSSSSARRKSTIISMLCERDPLMPLLTLSFVSASPDECTYFFEARSSAACATVETAKQSLSPAGVFGVIALIAVIVYVVGGCVYSRMVLNQRGWRQVPNYNLWAGFFGFFKDIFVVATSSCARFMPSRRGYSRVNGGLGGTGRGRSGRDSEAENRLIDELNEEWDD